MPNAEFVFLGKIWKCFSITQGATKVALPKTPEFGCLQNIFCLRK